MGEAALIQLCIVVMLMILFVLNFFFVRAVDKSLQMQQQATTTAMTRPDPEEQQQQQHAQDADDDGNMMLMVPTLVSSLSSDDAAIEMTSSSSTPSSSPAQRQNLDQHHGTTGTTAAASSGTGTSTVSLQSRMHCFLYGVALDDVYREYNVVYQFPGWHRKWAAIIPTVGLVMASSWILSSSSSLWLVRRMTSTTTTATSLSSGTTSTTNATNTAATASSSSASATTTSTDFCSNTNVGNNDTTLSIFQATLHNVTNLADARTQVSRMIVLFQALQDDVTLYGEPGYECTDVGNNNNATTIIMGDDNNTNFLPGTKARYVADQWPARNGPFFPGYCQAALTKSIELAASQQCERRVCAEVKRFGITWAERCVNVVEACPAASADTQIQKLQDYESTQQRIVQARVDNQTAIDFANDFVEDYYNSDKDEGHEEMYQRVRRLLSKVLRQVNVAGTIYTFYACISLLLPAPIILFRSPARVELYRFLFGVNRYQFVALVVMLWWAVEYSTVVWYSPQIRLLALNMMRDPCFVDGDLVAARHRALTDVCDEMLTLVNNFTLLDRAIEHTLEQAESFAQTCSEQCGAFPNVHLAKLQAATSPKDTNVFFYLGFTHEPTFYLERVWFPGKNDTFKCAGNVTVCSSPVEAQRILLSTTTSDVSVNYWELWVASGLVASMLIKFVVANFGLSLYFVADPLARCGGRFEYPPGINRSSAHFQNLRDQAWTSLWATSIKWSFLWFSLMLSCVVSLYIAAEQQRSTAAGSEISRTAMSIVSSGAVLCFLYACLIVCVRLDKSTWIRHLITCGKPVKGGATTLSKTDVGFAK